MSDPAPPAVARTFVHDTCGGTTEMPADQVHGRLTNPHGYNDWVYCKKCDGYVARRECRWADTGENLAEFFDRAKAAVAPRPSASMAIAPVALAAMGGVVGYAWDGGRGAAWGAAAGLALGLVVLVLRSIGLR